MEDPRYLAALQSNIAGPGGLGPGAPLPQWAHAHPQQSHPMSYHQDQQQMIMQQNVIIPQPVQVQSPEWIAQKSQQVHDIQRQKAHAGQRNMDKRRQKEYMPHQRDQRTHHNRDTQRAQQLQTGQHEWAGNQARRDGRVQKPATNYAKKPKAPKVVDTMDKGIQTDPINPLDFVGKDKIAAPPAASNTSMTNTTTLITKTTTTTNTPKMRKKKLGAKTKRKMNRKKLKPKPSASPTQTQVPSQTVLPQTSSSSSSSSSSAATLPMS